ncbi:PepSY domain-containing protein [Salibacterium halotolerans]|uniref:Peptidase propeptide and YPEB domain-containing protein n=1 Tax=Salibacterium halotolerans TaxID=1884432 RepID=A0A1I5PA77_9BACI|nr:PepSY domain-containing protein [Salibacterium halotolerans]SFP30873.1 Peptidase propeptide and YPEB domain-containing protein [Salibacterium halotolerans]
MKYTISIALVTVFLVLAGWQGFRLWGGEERVSAEDVRQKVEEQYSGSITGIRREGNQYLVSLSKETGKYELEVSREDGNVLRMEQTQAAPSEDNTAGTSSQSQSPETQEAQETPEKPETSKKTPEPMTKEQAETIALERVSGTVDDIERESSESGSFFLVEIEREDEREATVQVNSITGEIMSVTWDD